MLVAGLGADGGVGVAADLHLEDLQRGAVAGLEQVVQDLAALRLRIVDQQPAVAAAAADRADAVEGPPARRAVDGDRGGRLRRRRVGDQRARQCDEQARGHCQDCGPAAMAGAVGGSTRRPRWLSSVSFPSAECRPRSGPSGWRLDGAMSHRSAAASEGTAMPAPAPPPGEVSQVVTARSKALGHAASSSAVEEGSSQVSANMIVRKGSLSMSNLVSRYPPAYPVRRDDHPRDGLRPDIPYNTFLAAKSTDRFARCGKSVRPEFHLFNPSGAVSYGG